MSAAASSVSALQFQTMLTQPTDYAKIEEKDKPAFEQWLKLKKRLIEINDLPKNKLSERRRVAQDLLTDATTKFEELMEKYDFLLKEYYVLTKTLSRYINAQVRPLEGTAMRYFQDLFLENGQKIVGEPKFFTKKGGDQLGKQMRIEYFVGSNSEEKRTVDYFVKTHQGGAKSGQSSTRPLDPKELFVYKVLEYTGLGPKVHFILNRLSLGGFYTRDQ